MVRFPDGDHRGRCLPASARSGAERRVSLSVLRRGREAAADGPRQRAAFFLGKDTDLIRTSWRPGRLRPPRTPLPNWARSSKELAAVLGRRRRPHRHDHRGRIFRGPPEAWKKKLSAATGLRRPVGRWRVSLLFLAVLGPRIIGDRRQRRRRHRDLLAGRRAVRDSHCSESHPDHRGAHHWRRRWADGVTGKGLSDLIRENSAADLLPDDHPSSPTTTTPQRNSRA